MQVLCNGCHKKIPNGRYKCLQCSSLDLCTSCISGGLWFTSFVLCLFVLLFKLLSLICSNNNGISHKTPDFYVFCSKEYMNINTFPLVYCEYSMKISFYYLFTRDFIMRCLTMRIKTWIYCNQISALSLGLQNILYFLLKGYSPTKKKEGVLDIILDCIWWWGSSSGDLGSVVYHFLAITPRYASDREW